MENSEENTKELQTKSKHEDVKSDDATGDDSTPTPKPDDNTPAPSPSIVKEQLTMAPPKSRVPVINYNGQTIVSAASQGNLPVCVLLWGMASAKKQSLMVPDAQGNNPMHYACLAPTAEVIGFFQQQLRGMLTPEVRLVDSRNSSGETPLLRSMSTGQMPVIKVLLDEGSDPLVSDNNGGNVIMNCAKNCQFWCLCFMYDHIRAKHGVEAVHKLVTSRDCNDWSALEWAVEAGDLNCVEFLIRKGLNPFRVLPTGQNLLHIALARHRIDIALFLLDIGCDPKAKDKDGVEACNVHSLKQDRELRWAINDHPAVARSFSQLVCRCGSSTPDKHAAARGLENLEDGVDIPPLASSDGSSFAIRRLSPTRLWALLTYALFILGLWLLAIVVPFYGWVPLVGLAAGGYSWIANKVGTLQQRAVHAKGRLLLEPWQQVIGAPEKYVGFWAGNFTTYLFYFLNVIGFTYSSSSDDDDTDDHTYSLDGSRNPLGIAGLDCMKKDPGLVWMAILFMCLTIFFWLRIMIETDPGIVDTRQHDFDEVVADSVKLGGAAPNNTTYCRTTLVKKPIRSKYCTGSGFVVARMDHHCVWLNNAIGFGNHRIFMGFLYSHMVTNILGLAIFIRILIRETLSSSPSAVTGELVSQRLLLVTGLTAFLLVISCGILVLVVEQTHNIATNMTTNEKVNRSRYWWMKANDGRPLNRFDRGIAHNVMEFLGAPGFSLDYRSLLTLPAGSPGGGISGSSSHGKTDGGVNGTEMTTSSPMQQQQCSHDGNCKHNH